MWAYLYATLGYLGLIVFRASLSAFGSIKASEQTHRLMLSRVLNAPIHWYDTTPLGRVLNRFSSDLAAVDTEVMDELYSMVDAGAQLLAVFVVILASMPWLAVVMLPIALASLPNWQRTLAADLLDAGGHHPHPVQRTAVARRAQTAESTSRRARR